MRDVERELRELFERKSASTGGVAPRLPERVRNRGRRRQAGTAMIGAFTVLAVVLVSFAGLRAIDRGGADGRIPANDPWSGYEIFERTATIGNFTITSPSDWYLVDQWPWARFEASDLRDARQRDMADCSEEPTPDQRRACRSSLMGVPGDGYVAPVLMLSNTDRGLTTSPCFDRDTSIGATDAVMTIAFDALYFAANVGSDDRSQWPVPFDTPPADDRPSCGPGTYVYFASGDYPYVAHFAFGADIADAERQVLIEAFETMQVGTNEGFIVGEDPRRPSAAYVIAGGENAAGPWTLELRPQADAGYIFNVQLELTTPEGAGVLAGGPFTVGQGQAIEQAGGDPVFGAVVEDADEVELRLEEGTPPVPATLVPLPRSMPFDFDLFFAPNDTDVQATAVALGPDGEPLPAEPAPQGSAPLILDRGVGWRVVYRADQGPAGKIWLEQDQVDPYAPILVEPMAPTEIGDWRVAQVGDGQLVVFGIVGTDVQQVTLTSDSGQAAAVETIALEEVSVSAFSLTYDGAMLGETGPTPGGRLDAFGPDNSVVNSERIPD